jgi:hypothetical protein
MQLRLGHETVFPLFFVAWQDFYRRELIGSRSGSRSTVIRRSPLSMAEGSCYSWHSLET